MFWNDKLTYEAYKNTELTVNMKCFEISIILLFCLSTTLLTVNMKCFEIYSP